MKPAGGPPADPARFWTLCAAIGLMFVGHTMIAPLAPLYSVALGASPAVIGVVIAAAFLFPLFLAIPAGSLVDRYGSRGMLIAGTLLVGLSPFLVPLFPGFAALGLLQVLGGLGQLLAVVAAQSFVATLGGGRRREQNFGWYSTFISGGQLLGPLIAGVTVDLLGFEEAFALSGVLSTLSVLLVVRLRQPERTVSSEPHRFPSPAQVSRLLRNPGVQLALLVSGTLMIPALGYQSFLPAYLDLLAFPATVIGAVISLRALVTIMVRPFMPLIISHLGGRFRTLLVTMTMSIVGLAGIVYGDSIWALACVALLVGVGLGIAQPLTMVAVVDRVAAKERGMAFGLRLTANRLMQVTGPLALGLIAQTVGFQAMFPIAALISCTSIVLLLARRGHFAGVEAEADVDVDRDVKAAAKASGAERPADSGDD
ncbi:MAG: MFS transporter [Trueperaceae bacterium]